MSPSPRRTRINRLPMMSVQPSSTRSSDSGMPDTRLLKFSMRRSCQPGSRVAAHSGSVGTVVAHVDRRRRALEHVQLSRTGAEVRDALHCRGAGPDDAHALVGEALEAAVGPTARVVVVPAARVERVALEGRDALDARQLRDDAAARSPSRCSGPASRRRGSCRRSSADPSSSQRISVTSVWKQALRYRSKCRPIAWLWARISAAFEYFSFGM